MKSKLMNRAALAALFAAGACAAETDAPQEPAQAEQGRKVDASGKADVALEDVPAEVLEAVRAARPDMQVLEAEYETRDGNEYYDIEGTNPDGSEIELDLTKVDDEWTVVEIQRDITVEETPDFVLESLEEARPGFSPTRIIESDQGDGVIVYEFYQQGADGELEKAEVKAENGAAEFLIDEWAH